MKEALDNGQEGEIKAKKCINCKLMYGHSDFEQLCSVCFKKKKAEQNIVDVKLEEYQEDEQDSNSSISLSQGGQNPRKQRQQHSEDDESQQSNQTHFIIEQPQQNQKQVKLQYEGNDFFLRKIKKQDQTQKQSQPQEQQQYRLSLKRGPPQLIKIQKDRCNSCNRRLGLLGFQCGFCKINFCKNHRIPQQHDCIADYLTKGRKRLKRTLLQNSISKKHKGKVLEI